MVESRGPTSLLRLTTKTGDPKAIRFHLARAGMPIAGDLKRGGAPVYFLKGLGAVIPQEEIDRLILVSYPSTESFVEMIESDEYQKTAHFRTGAIELGLLFPFSYE